MIGSWVLGAPGRRRGGGRRDHHRRRRAQRAAARPARPTPSRPPASCASPALDGRDSGFFTLIVLVTLVLGGLLDRRRSCWRLGSRPTPTRSSACLATGLLGLEVLGVGGLPGARSCSGFRHLPASCCPPLALPVLVVATVAVLAAPGAPAHRGRVERRAWLTTSLRTDLFIGGEWRPAESGERFDVVDPGTEEVIAQVANAGAADARAAAAAAAADAQPEWAATAPRASAPRCCAARGSCSPSGPTTWPG